eukprot:scaffold325_cov343-Pavlova_lutheri.AAC.11
MRRSLRTLETLAMLRTQRNETDVKTIVPSQEDKIQAILKAANVEVEPYWPGMFAKLLAKKDMGDLITNVGAAGPAPAAGAAPAAAAGGNAEAAKAEEAPEEEEEEEMDFDLFD